MAKDVIKIIYCDRDRIIELNEKPVYIFDDTDSFIKQVMKLARKYPEAEIVEVYE